MNAIQEVLVLHLRDELTKIFDDWRGGRIGTTSLANLLELHAGALEIANNHEDASQIKVGRITSILIRAKAQAREHGKTVNSGPLSTATWLAIRSALEEV